jgi:hypothetical protein
MEDALCIDFDWESPGLSEDERSCAIAAVAKAKAETSAADKRSLFIETSLDRAVLTERHPFTNRGASDAPAPGREFWGEES